MVKNINLTLNLTALKILGILVTLIGCFGFIYGIIKESYVMESITVIGMGLGVLGYRKSLVTKGVNFNDNKNKDVEPK